MYRFLVRQKARGHLLPVLIDDNYSFAMGPKIYKNYENNLQAKVAINMSKNCSHVPNPPFHCMCTFKRYD